VFVSLLRGFTMLRIFTITALLAAMPAAAQTPLRATLPDSFKFLSAQELDQALMTPERGRVYSGHVINDHEDYWVEFMKRMDHGNVVEFHAHWIDHITVLSGEGSVSYGGDLTGASPAGAGETRGGTLTGATVQPIKPGDYIQIPAGVPHLINAAPGQELKFVLFKHRV
jgi:quercetin dioxygenase-like cupin family protein